MMYDDVQYVGSVKAGCPLAACVHLKKKTVLHLQLLHENPGGS